MTNLPKYTEAGFAPATLGGMAIHLQTDQGFFYVFNIDGNLDDIEFCYSPDGKMLYDEIDYTKNYEIDSWFGDGTYDGLKPHVQKTIDALGLNDKARGLYEAWKKEMDAPVSKNEDEISRIRKMDIPPELKKKLLAIWIDENED